MNKSKEDEYLGQEFITNDGYIIKMIKYNTRKEEAFNVYKNFKEQIPDKVEITD